MARPSQYSHGRRIGMQAALFVVLVGTLALAALVGRSRERAMAVELTAKPHLTERLAIRLPKGWLVDERGDGLPLTVSATAPLKDGASEATDIKEARGVRVHQTASVPAGGAPELLGRFLSDTPGQLGKPKPFPVLGQTGVIARFDEHQIDRRGQTFDIPSWYAAAVVPGAGPGGGDLGILLAAEGVGTDGPAGPRLLRQLADGISVRTH